MAGVERRLAAADLAFGDHHLEAGLAQQRLRIRDRLREDEIAQTRHEQLNCRHGYVRIAPMTRASTSASRMIAPFAASIQ